MYIIQTCIAYLSICSSLSLSFFLGWDPFVYQSSLVWVVFFFVCDNDKSVDITDTIHTERERMKGVKKKLGTKNGYFD